MLRIKIFVIVGILFLVGIVLSSSERFASSAKGDVFEEIANYKTWTRITKEPIKTAFQIDGTSGSQNTLVIDGREIIKFRPGTLNG